MHLGHDRSTTIQNQAFQIQRSHPSATQKQTTAFTTTTTKQATKVASYNKNHRPFGKTADILTV